MGRAYGREMGSWLFGVGVFLGWLVDFERGCGWTACKLRQVGNPKCFWISDQGPVQCVCLLCNAAANVAKVARDSWKGLGVGDNMDERKDCGG